jgi:hypothetical protein
MVQRSIEQGCVERRGILTMLPKRIPMQIVYPRSHKTLRVPGRLGVFSPGLVGQASNQGSKQVMMQRAQEAMFELGQLPTLNIQIG